MGFNASMVIVKQPPGTMSDEALLKMLGFINVSFLGDTTLEECMYPRDKSVNLGHYNDCLIISEDYHLTTSLEMTKDPRSLSHYEEVLTSCYPDTEILTVACHSGVNYHLYSLVKNGRKLRFKRAVAGEPTIEYGDWIEEEERVYAYSKIIDGQRMFRSPYKDDQVYDCTEDQLMEDFAFGVAKRHLGVMISMGESEILTFETPFRKYAVKSEEPQNKEVAKNTPVMTEPGKGSWLSRLFSKRNSA